MGKKGGGGGGGGGGGEKKKKRKINKYPSWQICSNNQAQRDDCTDTSAHETRKQKLFRVCIWTKRENLAACPQIPNLLHYTTLTQHLALSLSSSNYFMYNTSYYSDGPESFISGQWMQFSFWWLLTDGRSSDYGNRQQDSSW